MSTDQAAIQKRASAFYDSRRKKQRAHSTRTGQPLGELQKRTPAIAVDCVESYFSKDRIEGVSGKIVVQIKERLHSILKSINGFPPDKRFYILQTIDFFHTPGYMDKVIPALHHANESDQKVVLLDFVYSTFIALNKNIETIISIPELFSQEAFHTERGGLYSLTIDIAHCITDLFTETYLAQFKGKTSPVARVQSLYKIFRAEIRAGQDAVAISQATHLIQPHEKLLHSLLHFISLIQTHDLLVLYAKKRHLYYLRFLKTIRSKSSLGGLDPFSASLVLAACLLANNQLLPGDELLQKMTSIAFFDSAGTDKAFFAFVDQLSPAAVYRIIGDYKQSASEIMSGKVVKEKGVEKKLWLSSVIDRIKGETSQ